MLKLLLVLMTSDNILTSKNTYGVTMNQTRVQHTLCMLMKRI